MAYCILKPYKLKVDPYVIFEAFANRRNCFFLDSSLKPNVNTGRYSFLGFEPFLIFKSDNQDPFYKLRDLLDRYKISFDRAGIPFLGGAVGYFGYEVGFSLEDKIRMRPKPGIKIPDCLFSFYNSAVIIDHLKKQLYIVSTGHPEKKHSLQKFLARDNFKKIHALLSSMPQKLGTSGFRAPKSRPAEITSNFTKDDYLRAVKRAKGYIKRGDIYQVNLTQQFRAISSRPATDIYRALRNINPTHFGVYFDAGDFHILSSSPERFIKLENKIVTTSPMKGTRPRSKNIYKDKQLQRQLASSQKDKAELLMIVDLERNDLGRVCDYKSIKVDTHRQIEKYNTVFQTTSTISGRLHKDKDRIDLLRACFPGGSITGCPKIRAMQIIDELEPDKRSIYTGCLGYFSFSGNMDFNILIRTILKKQKQLYFGSGGGIVADSVPISEYNEVLVKAKAMMKAIGNQ